MEIQEPGQERENVMCGDAEEPILIVASDEEHCREIGSVLREEAYRFTVIPLPEQLEERVQGSGIRVAIVDLDTAHVSNRFIRELRKRNPMLWIIGISGRAFHPELKEALSEDLFACIRKPLDPDELLYLLRSILKTKQIAG